MAQFWPFKPSGRGIKIRAGAFALAFLAVLVFVALSALILQAAVSSNVSSSLDSYLWRVARFTLYQALLSALFSVLIAVPVARALHQAASGNGKSAIIRDLSQRLFALPLALPALVAVLGITSIYGRNGWVSTILEWFGFDLKPDIYGLTGILIAHVFFNMPLAVRLLLAGLDQIPNDYWKLSAQLGLPAFSRFRLIEWPVMRKNLPGIAGLIFMLCVTSFTTVLTLGGGPRATTLEVAIYQSLHFDFDLNRAVILTFAQLGLTLIVLAMLRLLGKASEEGISLSLYVKRYDRISTAEKWINIFIIMAGFAFVALPIVGVIISGLFADYGRLLSETRVWQAIITSIILGASSAVIAVILALALVVSREQVAERLSFQAPRSFSLKFFERCLDLGPNLILVVPPIVLGAGWFIFLRGWGNPFSFAAPMVIAVNAAMAMPFAVRLLRPAWDNSAYKHNRLCAQLGIKGLTRIWLIDWPVMRRPISVAFAFAMALSLGDLGTIALFGSDRIQTLPYLLLQRMGSYRTDDAAGLALILGLLCLALMILADRFSSSQKRGQS